MQSSHQSMFTGDLLSMRNIGAKYIGLSAKYYGSLLLKARSADQQPQRLWKLSRQVQNLSSHPDLMNHYLRFDKESQVRRAAMGSTNKCLYYRNIFVDKFEESGG